METNLWKELSELLKNNAEAKRLWDKIDEADREHKFFKQRFENHEPFFEAWCVEEMKIRHRTKRLIFAQKYGIFLCDNGKLKRITESEMPPQRITKKDWESLNK